jgi:hypothetical protein
MCLAGEEMDMHKPIRSTIMAAMCIAVAVAAFADSASAGPISVASSSVIQAPSVTDQVYYRRYHGGYYRRGYAYGPRRFYGYPAYGYPAYGYGYPPPYPYPYGYRW